MRRRKKRVSNPCSCRRLQSSKLLFAPPLAGSPSKARKSPAPHHPCDVATQDIDAVEFTTMNSKPRTRVAPPPNRRRLEEEENPSRASPPCTHHGTKARHP
ncbi:hypothetical protein M0R45_026297 [Rubus argutus]|uniref:Uncharacterized protein n=1 Tax=Rubus argutus TaxID=59490 RepID=A0AAW1WX55_RUBAR